MSLLCAAKSQAPAIDHRQTVFVVLCHERNLEGEIDHQVFCSFSNDETAYQCAFHEILESINSTTVSIPRGEQFDFFEQARDTCKSSQSWQQKYRDLELLVKRSPSFLARFSNDSLDEEFLSWHSVQDSRLISSKSDGNHHILSVLDDLVDQLYSDDEEPSKTESA